MGLEQYQGDMDMCCRCSACKFIPMQKVKGHQYAYACPSISKYNFHAYSGGGRLNIGAAMLKDGFKYTMYCGAFSLFRKIDGWNSL